MVLVGKGSSNIPALWEKTPEGGRLGGPDTVSLTPVGTDVGASGGVGVGVDADPDADRETVPGTDADSAEIDGNGASEGRPKRFGSSSASDGPGVGGAASFRGCSAHFAMPSTFPSKPSDGGLATRLRIAWISCPRLIA
jgi:hypothetical protein